MQPRSMCVPGSSTQLAAIHTSSSMTIVPGTWPCTLNGRDGSDTRCALLRSTLLLPMATPSPMLITPSAPALITTLVATLMLRPIVIRPPCAAHRKQCRMNSACAPMRMRSGATISMPTAKSEPAPSA